VKAAPALARHGSPVAFRLAWWQQASADAVSTRGEERASLTGQAGKPATQPLPGKAAAYAEDAPALSIENLTRAYDSLVALDCLWLSLKPSEVVALVGHSGSGKSTLLRLVAGLERPTGGSIAVNGRTVTGPGVFVPPEQRGIGMVFQDYALFPHLRVDQNVKFGLRGLAAQEADHRAEVGLKQVGLFARRADYPHMLSGGEQQRVALARALAPRPDVLLMDEPFSNLDRHTKIAIRDDIRAVLRQAGTTVLFVTHDAEDALHMADRIMLMRSGRIIEGGTAEEMYSHPRTLLGARFFADFDEMEGIAAAGAVTTPVGVFATHLPDGARVTVCIPPHAIRVAAGGPAAQAGRVVARVFVGDAPMLTVAVPGLSRPLHLRVPEDNTIGVGDRFEFVIAADEVLVFPSLD
jgi:iron(III) transport system ATP-binding protein